MRTPTPETKVQGFSKGYVNKLNGAIQGSGYENQPLEEIIARAHEADDTAVFNNAAQAWNHTFLWHSMSPNAVDELINWDFAAENYESDRAVA